MADQIMADLTPELYDRLLDFMRRNPDLSGDDIVSMAVERYLDLEESPSTLIPVDLLQDFMQVCIWVQMMADLQLDANTLQAFAAQASKIELQGKEYHLGGAIAPPPQSSI